MNSHQVQEKWKSVIEHADLSPIQDAHKRAVTATILENTEIALRESAGQGAQQQLLAEDDIPTNALGGAGYTGSSTASGPVAGYDPILISLVRRAMPNLMAYDVCGVQPMTGPTGLIFAMRSKYTNQGGTEAFYNEADTGHSTVRDGANTPGGEHAGSAIDGGLDLPSDETYNYAGAMPTAQAEALGTTGNTDFAEMAFSIEKVTVTAGSRALKADYSLELAQDLKAVHGLDAEAELSNILATEILAEINREVIRSIYVTSKRGAEAGTTTAGTFDLDTDANGRWSVEKFKGLMFFIEQEANKIAKETRRGRGNMIICSSDVASALQMAGVLDYTPALASNNLSIDDTGNTFAGVLNGKYKVYIDPYAGSNYLVVGYKGANAMDAGLFYCPYVPLQMVRAIDQNSFQPKIGFKTRYGMVANPFSKGGTASDGSLEVDSNVYYRRALVTNLL